MRSDVPVCYIYADAGNVGDRVSAMGVRFLVSQPGIELFASRAGLGTTIGTLKWLQKNRAETRVLVGGGGLLQECFMPFWVALMDTELRFALFGVGANEIPGIRNLPPENMLRSLTRRAVAIHVRDEWTREILQSSQKKQVSLGVCPSINYLVSKFQRNHGGAGSYLLHVQHPVDVRMSGGDPERISAILKSLSADLNLCYDETSHIKDNLNGLARRYQRARFVVSSRLHGCIFSYAFGIPFVPILADKKTAAFVKTHIPENPVADVHLGKNEILEKVLYAEEQCNKTNDMTFTSVLSNNVASMQRILRSF
jgi:polysaccharide pyruvyl transferase WcaK-like protein